MLAIVTVELNIIDFTILIDILQITTTTELVE